MALDEHDRSRVIPPPPSASAAKVGLDVGGGASLELMEASCLPPAVAERVHSATGARATPGCLEHSRSCGTLPAASAEIEDAECARGSSLDLALRERPQPV